MKKILKHKIIPILLLGTLLFPQGIRSVDAQDESSMTDESLDRNIDTYTYEDDSITAAVTISDASALPDDAQPVVTQVTEDTDGCNYRETIDATKDAVDISENDIVIDPVDADVSADAESVSIELTGFSPVAIHQKTNGEETSSTVNANPITDFSLYTLLNNYNMVVFENANELTHTNGAVLIGGNASFNSNGIFPSETSHQVDSYIGGNITGMSGYKPNSDHVLVISKTAYDGLGNSIYDDNGNIIENWANVYYASSETPFADMTAAKNSIENEVAAYAETVSADNNWAEYSTSERRIYTGIDLNDGNYGWLTVYDPKITVGTNVKLHVNNTILSFDSANSTSADTIIYDDSAGEVTLRVNFKTDSSSTGESGKNGNTVYMFPNATRVHVISEDGDNMKGHVIAPNATVVFDSDSKFGNYNGCIIAKNFESGAREGHIHSYGGKKITPAGLTFGGTKNVTSESENLPSAQFTFELSEVKENNRITSLQSVTRTGEGTYQFNPITYTASDVGIHTYKVKEIAGNADGYTYDTTEYTITVSVTLDESSGKISTDITDISKKIKNGDTEEEQSLTGQDKDAKKLDFTNIYTKKETVSASVTKVWSGDDANTDHGEITVQLYRTAAGVTDSEEPVGEPITLSETAGWTKTVDELDQKDAQDHTYSYYFREVSNGEKIADGNTITVNENQYRVSYADSNNNTTITNTLIEKEKVPLPETGGAGTTGLLYGGLTLFGGAILGKYKRKNKNERKQ